MKILPLETDLFHAHGRTDGHSYMTKLIVAFRNFEIALKNCKILCVILLALYNQ